MVNSALNDTKWLALRNHGSARLKKVDLNGKSELLFRYSAGQPKGTWAIHLDRRDGPLLTSIPISVVKDGWGLAKIKFQPVEGVHDLFFTYSNPALKHPEDTGDVRLVLFTQPFPGKGQKDTVPTNISGIS
jgi:hypothetical protein